MQSTSLRTFFNQFMTFNCRNNWTICKKSKEREVLCITCSDCYKWFLWAKKLLHLIQLLCKFKIVYVRTVHIEGRSDDRQISLKTGHQLDYRDTTCHFAYTVHLGMIKIHR